RLNKALQSPKIEEDMDMEDEVIDEFNKKDAIIEAAKKEAEQEKQRAEQEKQRAEQEKQRAEQEKQRAEQEKQRAEQEKQRAEQEKQSKYQLIRNLYAIGQSPSVIAELAQMTEDEVRAILESD
ncbi:MAG: hypothetical protein AAF847_19375, partial [Bacteroidota bacterium]